MVTYDHDAERIEDLGYAIGTIRSALELYESMPQTSLTILRNALHELNAHSKCRSKEVGLNF